MSGPHSAAAGGRKSSASQGAAQVVLGVAVTVGKVRAAQVEERFDFGSRQAAPPALGLRSDSPVLELRHQTLDSAG